MIQKMWISIEELREMYPLRMGIDLTVAGVETPKVSEWWRFRSELRRMAIIHELLMMNDYVLIVKGASDDGRITVEIPPMSAAERGTFLLNVEAFLKKTVDFGITVWLETMGDKNTLRHLRAVEVKA